MADHGHALSSVVSLLHSDDRSTRSRASADCRIAKSERLATVAADARNGRHAKVLAVAAVALASVGKPGVASASDTTSGLTISRPASGLERRASAATKCPTPPVSSAPPASKQAPPRVRRAEAMPEKTHYVNLS